MTHTRNINSKWRGHPEGLRGSELVEVVSEVEFHIFVQVVEVDRPVDVPQLLVPGQYSKVTSAKSKALS